jgi:F0F1-type ATP synthase epsilon subunit
VKSVFELTIMTPMACTKITVEWVEIESPTGSFLIGAGHSPLVSIIKNKGSIIYKKPHEEPIQMHVSEGFFKIEKNRAVAMLDH